MKLLLWTIAILFAVFGLAAPVSADPGDPGPPLRVKVVTFDGKQKIKVAKKVRLVTSCSKDCNAMIKVRLITPVTTYRYDASTGIPATGTWTVGLRLTPFARNYIKKNLSRSRLEVTFTGTDIETGLKPSTIKTYRFRK